MKYKIETVKSIIQLKQKEQDDIFEKLIEDLGVEGGADELILLDYCFNNFKSKGIEKWLK